MIIFFNKAKITQFYYDGKLFETGPLQQRAKKSIVKGSADMNTAVRPAIMVSSARDKKTARQKAAFGFVCRKIAAIAFLPRSSYRGEKPYNEQISVEKLNSLLEGSFGLENPFIQGLQKMLFSGHRF